MDKKIFAYLYDANFPKIKEVDFTLIDYVNYSFGKIKDHKLDLSHLLYLDQYLQKANGKTKTILSIGGWGAGGFSEMASSFETRQVFVDTVIDAIKTYNFAGIDLDWEYPTSSVANIKSSKDDKVNFTFLLEDLKNAFKEHSLDVVLTIAAGASTANYMECDKIGALLDYFHIMTYDFMDTKNNTATHHTNLFPSKYQPNISADQAVRTFVEHGIPQDKIVIGGAFYARITKVSDGVFPIGQVGLTPITQGIPYTKLHHAYLNNPDYTYHFDEEAKAPWLVGNNEFITFDSTISLQEKCLYVRRNNLSGFMFWELGSDETFTLLEEIHASLKV